MGKSLALLICVSLMLVLVSTRVVFADEDEDKAESWTEWAKDKLNKNFGIDQNETEEKAKELMKDAGDATSEASKYASEKAKEAAKATGDGINKAKEYVQEKADGRMTMEKPYRKGKRVLRSLSESAAEQGKDTMEKSKNAYNEAKETVKSGSETAKERVEGAYDEAKNKVGEAYEGAKEKASEAADKVEVKMD